MKHQHLNQNTSKSNLYNKFSKSYSHSSDVIKSTLHVKVFNLFFHDHVFEACNEDFFAQSDINILGITHLSNLPQYSLWFF